MRSPLTTTLLAFVLAAPGISQPAERPKAQSLVKEAVAFAKSHGKEALLKEANHSQGRFHVKAGNDLYIFIYDKTGVCLGMGFQANLVGVNRWGLKDPDGKFIIQELIQTAMTKGNGWVDYRYLNPKSAKVEAKSSYVEALDDWVVGCGFYK